MTPVPQTITITAKPLILASQSPRRRSLLEAAGLSFRVVPSEIQEADYEAADPADYAKTLATAKAMAVAEQHPASWVIGADSIVLINGQILEKPASIADARRMMRLLGGRTHEVMTGYAIVHAGDGACVSDVELTQVTFKSLTETDIEWYIHTPEPYDKAGGYAIQGLGSFMVRRINGSYTNVVGLPVCEVLDRLQHLGVISRHPAASPRSTAPGKDSR